MLLWQRKSVPNVVRVWGIFFGCSFAAHLLVLGVILYIAGRGEHYTFTMHQSIDVDPVIVVLRSASSSSAVSRAQSPHNVPGVRAASAAKSTTVVTAPGKKIVQKKTIKKARKKKTPAKKMKAAIPDKKKSVQEVKKIKSTDQKKEIAQIPQQVPVQQKAVEAVPVSQAGESSEQAITISYTDMQYRERYLQLHSQLSQHWSPPPGIPDTCTCTLVAHVDKEGHVINIDITKPSGILMFDITARAALMAVSWPQWAWASSVEIIFKP